MVTGILTALVIGCLFYSWMPVWTLVILSVGLGAAFALASRHEHGGFLAIDILAQKSRLHMVPAGLKFWTALILMVLCICAKNPLVGLILAVAMLILTVAVGGLPLHDYLCMLALPVIFLMLSGLALLFDYSTVPDGVIRIPLFGGFLSVSRGAQARAMLIMSKAFGAVSCLYMLSLSTPMSEIIGVLRRIHVPAVFIELMYLIYRYIFVLLAMVRTMKEAAASRLGYVNYRTHVRTTGRIYSNLLAHSYRQANVNFDAMESRCFDGDIRFLEDKKNIRAIHVAVTACIIVSVAGLSFGLR
jgi:cobalt/nickel transport system permease protein